MTKRKRPLPPLDPNVDKLVPDNMVRAELAISTMGAWRWDRDPKMAELGWPPCIRIGPRKYRSRQALERFKQNLVRRAIAERGAR